MVLNIFKTLTSKSQEASSNQQSRSGNVDYLTRSPSSSLVSPPAAMSATTAGPSSSSGSTFRGSISAPSSPSRKSSVNSSSQITTATSAQSSNIPQLRIGAGGSGGSRMLPTSSIRQPSSGLHPVPNICVEKGRIEFIKTSAPSATAITSGMSATAGGSGPANIDGFHPPSGSIPSSKLVMGAKIFRPNSSSSSNIISKNMGTGSRVPEEVSAPSSGRPFKWNNKEFSGGNSLLRERSSSPKGRLPASSAQTPPSGATIFKMRDSGTTPPPPIPVSRIPTTRKIQNNQLPPPSMNSSGIRMIRESSPTPAAPGIPQNNNNNNNQMSPNLIRWRAKLSSSSSAGSAIPASGIGKGLTPPFRRHQHQQRHIPAAVEPVQTMEQEVSCAEGRLHNKSAAGDAGIAAGAELVRTPPPPTTTTLATAGPNDSTSSTSLGGSSTMTTTSNEQESANQMQLLNLRNQVKRLEETVQTLLPVRHQQSALIQSYEEKLSEAQARLAASEAEVTLLKERLAASESREAVMAAQLRETDKCGQDQQRLLFDKLLDDIANHVVQALISQKNLQGECRRLRSQVSDLEQRNVALNLILTQSLRDSIHPPSSGGIVKSASHDPSSGSGMLMNQRNSTISAVSESDLIRLVGIDDPTFVSKDSNWTLTSSGSNSGSTCSGYTAEVIDGGNGGDPVERAEKLLAVLKHRLFSAQIGSSVTGCYPASGRTKNQKEENPKFSQPGSSSSLPARPSSLSLKSAELMDPSKSASSGSQTPSVRALVQVLEQKKAVLVTAAPLTTPNSTINSAETPNGSLKKQLQTTNSSPRPPLPHFPPASTLGRTGYLRHLNSDSPASKDEGYSTMSSDVQVDSSSSSSSFIASGCSSPATLRRSGSTGSGSGSSAPPSGSRSLPTKRNKSFQLSSPTSAALIPPSTDQLIGAVIAQTTEIRNEDKNEQLQQAMPIRASSFKREWPGVQLGTLNEDWSPSSAASESEHPQDSTGEDEQQDEQLFDRHLLDKDSQRISKWTSDSELYRAEEEPEESIHPEESCSSAIRREFKTLHRTDEKEEEPVRLRRVRARIQLTDETSSGRNGHYSKREMEDWILSSSGEEEEEEELRIQLPQEVDPSSINALAAISENSYESDLDDVAQHVQLFHPDDIHLLPSDEEEDGPEIGNPDEESGNGAMDNSTDFTRDYYRLVKFESSRSLAGCSDKCGGGAAEDSSSSSATSCATSGNSNPPDRQVALQTVLDFIAEQQRYCELRRKEDSNSPEQLPPPEEGSSSNTTTTTLLGQLQSLIQHHHQDSDEDEEDGRSSSYSGRDADTSSQGEEEEEDIHRGFSTTWIPIHKNSEAAILENFLMSSSSSLSEDDEEEEVGGNAAGSGLVHHNPAELFLSLSGTSGPSFQGQARRVLYLPSAPPKDTARSSESHC